MPDHELTTILAKLDQITAKARDRIITDKARARAVIAQQGSAKAPVTVSAMLVGEDPGITTVAYGHVLVELVLSELGLTSAAVDSPPAPPSHVDQKHAQCAAVFARIVDYAKTQADLPPAEAWKAVAGFAADEMERGAIDPAGASGMALAVLGAGALAVVQRR
jgi:hypothetical protein